MKEFIRVPNFLEDQTNEDSPSKPFRPILTVREHPLVEEVSFKDGPPMVIMTVKMKNGEVRTTEGFSRSSTALLFMARNKDLFPTKDPIKSMDGEASVQATRVKEGRDRDKAALKHVREK